MHCLAIWLRPIGLYSAIETLNQMIREFLCSSNMVAEKLIGWCMCILQLKKAVY